MTVLPQILSVAEQIHTMLKSQFLVFIIIHPGNFYPQPDLNIHLHLAGLKAVRDAQQDDANEQDNWAKTKSSKFIFLYKRFC